MKIINFLPVGMLLVLFLFNGTSALTQTLEPSAIEKAFSTIYSMDHSSEMVSQYKAFKENKDFHRHQMYLMYVQNIEREIAKRFAEENNLKEFERWSDTIARPNLQAYALESGYKILVKTYDKSLLAASLNTRLVDLMCLAIWDNDQRNLFTALLYSYFLVSSPEQKGTALPYLDRVYEIEHYFQSDPGKLSLDSIPFNLSLTYLYAKLLSSNNQEQKALDVLVQGIDMALFTQQDINLNESDFQPIVSLSDKLDKEISKQNELFKANVAQLLKKSELNGRYIDKTVASAKYILIDFWGSWCIPCRASHPKLRELYENYKDKGLEIISIAHEFGQDAAAISKKWQQAVEADKMDWLQVLNNENQEKFDTVKAFSVGMFPTKILIEAKTFQHIVSFKGNTSTDKLFIFLKENL